MLGALPLIGVTWSEESSLEAQKLALSTGRNNRLISSCSGLNGDAPMPLALGQTPISTAGAAPHSSSPQQITQSYPTFNQNATVPGALAA